MTARNHHLLYDFIVPSESPSPQFVAPRVIPDVNVFLNGITGKPGSLNRRLYEGFTHGLVQFVISEPWLEEFERVLNYPQVINLGITPSLVAKTMRELIARVPNSDKVVWSTHCHNDLGMAVANSLAAVMGGARQVECTIMAWASVRVMQV